MIGETWYTRGGIRSVVGTLDMPDGPRFVVATDDGCAIRELVRPADLPAIVRAESSRAPQFGPHERPAPPDPLDGFGGGLPPMRIARLRATLLRIVSVRGQLATRAAHVRELVAGGFRAVDRPDGRRLESPDGSFFLERDLTAAALDYAAFLADSRFPAP